MLRRKIFAIMPQVARQPQLLSHLINEMMSFDTSLRDEWNYDGGDSLNGWRGLTWEVLVKKEWFSRWLEVEKTCTFKPSFTEVTLTDRKSLYPGIKTLLIHRKASR